MTGLPDDVAIGPLAAADLGEMLAVVGRCDATYLEWAPSDWRRPDAMADLPRWRANWDRPHRSALGAFDPEQTLIAFISWSQEVGPDERPVAGVAHVSALFVDPPRWNQGIGATLLGRAEGAMVVAGLATARLWTPERAPARTFYEAMGWSHDGQHDWHAPLGLAVVGYEKRLGPPPGA
jgi:GNAT superfamily N-acetyltransferase